ncbi:MAG: hypothetical protein AB3N23_12555 [Paracoccaceae bacterium]
MVRAVILLVVASLALSACGWRDSRLNPGNWFGRSQSVPVEAEAAEVVNPLIPTRNTLLSRGERPDLHVPIEQITTLAVDRTPTGAIIRVEGIARTQGAYDARLVTATEDGEPIDGVLSYTFEVLYPENPRPVGSQSSRKVIVARSLTNQDLRPIRVIRVTGAQNALETRR